MTAHELRVDRSTETFGELLVRSDDRVFADSGSWLIIHRWGWGGEDEETYKLFLGIAEVRKFRHHDLRADSWGRGANQYYMNLVGFVTKALVDPAIIRILIGKVLTVRYREGFDRQRLINTFTTWLGWNDCDVSVQLRPVEDLEA